MTTRMTIDFGPDQSAALDRIANRLGTTKAGILRYGLSLLQIALAEQSRGNAMGIVHGERVVKELAGIWAPPTIT